MGTTQKDKDKRIQVVSTKGIRNKGSCTKKNSTACRNKREVKVQREVGREESIIEEQRLKRGLNIGITEEVNGGGNVKQKDDVRKRLKMDRELAESKGCREKRGRVVKAVNGRQGTTRGQMEREEMSWLGERCSMGHTAATEKPILLPVRYLSIQKFTGGGDTGSQTCSKSSSRTGGMFGPSLFRVCFHCGCTESSEL